jgi:hypothetical protein
METDGPELCPQQLFAHFETDAFPEAFVPR